MQNHPTSHFLWAFLILALITLVAAFTLKVYKDRSLQTDAPLPIVRILSRFQLLNQDNIPVNETLFHNKISLVAFAFTRCPGPCPAIIQRLEQFQIPFRRARPYVQLVTFTVDPEYDTPEVLKRYSQSLKADPSLWHFLTGAKDEVFRVAEKDFLLPATENPPEAQSEHGAVLHSTRLVLVDNQARIRQYYDAFDPELLPKVLHDVGKLLREANIILPN
ncbi:MAG: SCO family protein [Verrucomicrobiae bacterium]|nr:SCO family protein [Verrucomicrobiae bacterium]